MKLNSKDKLTKVVNSFGIKTWLDLLQYVSEIPYGRTSNRTDFGLVITENRGTCSSKHALLKEIADLNEIPNIKLLIGIYRMNEKNTPNIGSELTKNGIKYIPEAHCYLMVNGKRKDYTSTGSEFQKIENDMLTEVEINPLQVGTYKVDFHQIYLRNWLETATLNLSFSELWSIREKCIQNLAEHTN